MLVHWFSENQAYHHFITILNCKVQLVHTTLIWIFSTESGDLSQAEGALGAGGWQMLAPRDLARDLGSSQKMPLLKELIQSLLRGDFTKSWLIFLNPTSR